MKVGSKQIEIPDECPKNCPGYLQSAGQGNICCRCPVFNCKLVIVDKDDPYMGGHAELMYDKYRKAVVDLITLIGGEFD